MKVVIPILLCLGVFTVSCNSDTQRKASQTYLGGEIVNPFSNEVLLVKNLEIVDTIPLDATNRFSYTFEDFTPGLYRFVHGEHQLVHIEEGDSILIRANTLEFDESLTFSGIGASKNNFLIDLYLTYEQENKGFTKHYQKDPVQFEQVLDSMYRARLKKYNTFKEKNIVSQAFLEVADAAMKLDNYQRKESYPFSHYGKNKVKMIEKLPEDFYSFRESVNLNNENISELYGFQQYAFRYLNQLAYLTYGDKKPYSTVSYEHNLARLQLVDSLITIPEVKDVLLTRSVELFISNNNSEEETKEIYDMYNNYISSPGLKNRIGKLYAANEKMHIGKIIPNQILIDGENRLVTLHNILKKPTVFYFWSYNRHAHLENSHRKIKDLESKYPEYDFIGVNINEDNERWHKALKQHHFDKTKEYQFKDFKTARKELVINAQGKAIIVSPEGKILNSHANLYRIAFENELLAYLNQ